MNPIDGSILRLTEMSRYKLEQFGSRMEDVDTMVEYGSVEIGGRAYLCPVKGVFVSFEPPLPLWYMTRIDADRFDRSWGLSEDPAWEMVNDMTFTNYHLFRAKAHILAGGAPEPDAAPSASSPATAPAPSSPQH